MSKKHLIACWLLVVYLLTAVGPAWASLSCRCISRHAAAGETAACCAHHHHHHHGPSEQSESCTVCEALEHAPVWSAPCCDDRHSTDIALYTGGDDDRTLRIPGSVALPATTDACTLTALETPGFVLGCDRRAGPPCHGTVWCAGAHAPPARA